jgi:hypothetical protein
MQVLVAPMEALPASLHDDEQQGDTAEDENEVTGQANAADDEEQQQLQEQHDEDMDDNQEGNEDGVLWQKNMQQGQNKSCSGSGVQLPAFGDDIEQGVARGRSAAAAARKARDIARGRRAASPITAAAAASQVGRGLVFLLLLWLACLAGARVILRSFGSAGVVPGPAGIADCCKRGV